MTGERQQELIAAYNELKKHIIEIDDKYSPNYQVVKIDFPPTLGLEKVTYILHPLSYYADLAQQQLEAKYTEKIRHLDSTYNLHLRNIKLTLAKLSATHQKKLDVLLKNYRKSMIALVAKLTDNGLSHSTLKENTSAQLLTDYETGVSIENNEYHRKSEAYEHKKSQLATDLQSAKSQLGTQKIAEEDALTQTLYQKAQREYNDTLKYNASVDEKETKYQASCARYNRYAQQAENERAIAILRLYTELGESGVDQRKKAEMLACCRSELSPFTKGEAEFIFAFDDFLQVYLGTYYDTLVEWAAVTLRPDN